MSHLCVPDNNRMFYIASNSSNGYTSQLFDRNLGYFDSFILDGSYIFAGQVRKIIIIKHVMCPAYPQKPETCLY